MQLDRYNEELKLAYKFQGSQHFSKNPMFHKRGQIDLDDQRTRDQKKRNLYKRQGIDLIEILYTCDLLPYIRTTLIEKGYLSNIGNSSK